MLCYLEDGFMDLPDRLVDRPEEGESLCLQSPVRGRPYMDLGASLEISV